MFIVVPVTDYFAHYEYFSMLNLYISFISCIIDLLSYEGSLNRLHSIWSPQYWSDQLKHKPNQPPISQNKPKNPAVN